MSLSQDEIRTFEKRLRAAETEIASEVKDLETVPDMGSDVDDFEEEAEEAEAFGAQVGMKQPIKERLARVREALRKIDAGTFGVCEKCKKPIEREVLEAAPESELCRACKLKSR